MPKLSLKEILIPTAALLAICVVITGALAGVNAVTKEPIAQNAQQEADAAKRELFPEAQEFVAAGDGIDMAVRSAEAALAVGYVVESQAQGYGGPIKIMVGITSEGVVKQVVVLDASGETPGLGQNVKNDDFLHRFVGAADFVTLGHGISDSLAGATGTAGKTVDAVASATYSSQGVVNAVNEALERYQTMGREQP
ncbi:MAG: FMN-binding protein [Oscillospiraceae bacterium]|jgi:electron transport complex protein RnfG|nr:FMN-binding protein [Oscillospiraceae bacterium]